MKNMSRIFLFGALTLILLTAACAGQDTTPTVIGTAALGDETASPPAPGTETTETAPASPVGTVNLTATIDTATLPAGTDTTQTPGTPVTGTELILVECQFCIENMAHALLVLPDTATFETVADTAAVSTPDPDTGCNTVDTHNGRQVVLCRSQENTSLNLNICTNGNNCTQLLVELQSCPDTTQPGATNTPDTGAPTNTPEAGLPTDTAVVGATDTPAVVTATPTP